MARRRNVPVPMAAIIVASVGHPSPPRRVGSLLLADGSGATFAQSIHRFDEPSQHPADTKDEGIDTVRASSLKWNDPQWRKRHPEKEQHS
uniref:Uncharacterized protein n=1 Tax=mine drainage metagenome TaxID=410659 RepID=E6QP84_9ZZZZ